MTVQFHLSLGGSKISSFTEKPIKSLGKTTGSNLKDA